VISQAWKGAEQEIAEECAGRLIVHRLPVEDWSTVFRPRPHPSLGRNFELALFQSGFYPQCFAWLAGLRAEMLIEQEDIDLIEAQDYEAPLYYLLLRRALGLGPRRQPPCVVHLHSPMEFIARYNDWNADSVWVQTAKRLEDYCIAAADTLLCPSRTFARQAEAHYGLPNGQIQVIPLPLGSSDFIERPKDTWERGAISYVGRLERRKGIIEWIHAGLAVAREFPEARFEFIGANILGSNRISSEVMIQEMIPADLKSRFIFRGEQERASLPGLLSKARLAVVPSRWENFPNSCIEAMSSGLPVIATRNGGMVEMIEDGRTGWLAQNPGSAGLAEALRRALATPPQMLAEMGSEASQAIRRLCDNQQVLASHLEFRSRAAAQPVQRSIHLPANLPDARQPFGTVPQRKAPQNASAYGLAIAISAMRNARALHATLQSIADQTREPLVVVFAFPETARLQALVKRFG